MAHGAATGAALARAGFRRYSTYRQAMLAGLTTNIVFGLLRTYVLMATVDAAGGTAAGYDLPRLVTYVWLGQGLLATVQLGAWSELADRIRTGDVVADLLRPVNPVYTYLAGDLGRAGYAVLTRMAGPIVFAAVFFPFHWPEEAASYPLFAASVVLAVVVGFGCRFLVNATAYWLLDIRGVTMLWTLASGALSGMYFPLPFLPGWLAALLQFGTPFPSLLQFPTDMLIERGGLGGQLWRLGVQAAWAVALLGTAHLVQRRAVRKLVVQGG